MNQHRSGATLVFIIVMLLVDVVSALVVSSSSGGMPRGLEMVFGGCISGLVFGQSIFAIVWSGLVGDSWLRSYFQAVGLAALAIFLVIMATVWGSSFGPTNWTRPLSTLLMIPLLGIIGSVPLWATRYLLGWRLLHNSQSTEKPKAVGVEDILLLTATVAGALMLTRAAIVIMMSGADSANMAWQSTLITTVVFGVISAPFSLGGAWIFFKSENSQARFLRMSGFGLATWVVTIVIMSVLAPGGLAGDGIAFLMFMVFSGFAILFFGFSCLDSDGLKLHRRGTKPVDAATSAIGSETPFVSVADESSGTSINDLAGNSTKKVTNDPFANVESSAESLQRANGSIGKKKQLERVLVAALVAAAVFFTAIANRKETRVQDIERAQKEMLNLLRSQAAEIDFESEEDVRNFRAKPTVDDSIADELDRYPGLRVVDLSGCIGITDRGATQIAKLPSLDRLILSGTSVSDNLFESINPGEFSLKELDLSNTKVTVAGIKKMFGIIRCQKLSLRGLNLSDADIKQLESLQCVEWDLRDNPISILPAKAKSISLGNSSFELTQLKRLAGGLQSLTIDGMDISDDEFIALLDQMPSLRFLSLKDTGLTDKSLDRIGNIGTLTCLEIGPGNFSGDVVFPSDFNLLKLRISHPNMNFGFLSTLGQDLQLVDLRGSGVTDADLASIQNLRHVSYVLDRTKVTIASIKHLMTLNAREISIRETGIIPADFRLFAAGAFFTRLIVDEKVFTDEVKKRLQRDLPIRFEDSLMFEFNDDY